MNYGFKQCKLPGLPPMCVLVHKHVFIAGPTAEIMFPYSFQFTFSHKPFFHMQMGLSGESGPTLLNSYSGKLFGFGELWSLGGAQEAWCDTRSSQGKSVVFSLQHIKAEPWPHLDTQTGNYGKTSCLWVTLHYVCNWSWQLAQVFCVPPDWDNVIRQNIPQILLTV